MPLAIELAASRLRALSLADLNDRLDQRFRLLTGGSRNAVPRQQTLLATVDWSYSLLTAPEQKLLRRLSVFVDGFHLDAAEAVCAGGDLDVFAVTDLVASLVDKNLVVAEPADGALRYRLLETIRQFAAERLIESGGSEADELSQAHCRYFLSVAEAAKAEFEGPEQVKWIRRLNAEQGNIWRAIDHAADAADVSVGTEQVLRFGAALVRYWVDNSQRERALGVIAPALARPEASADPSLRSTALASAAMIARGVDMELALRLGEEAMEIADQLGEDRLLIHAGTVLCCILYFAGMPDRGLAFGQSAVERARRSGMTACLVPAWSSFCCASIRYSPIGPRSLTPRPLPASNDRVIKASLELFTTMRGFTACAKAICLRPDASCNAQRRPTRRRASQLDRSDQSGLGASARRRRSRRWRGVPTGVPGEPSRWRRP